MYKNKQKYYKILYGAWMQYKETGDDSDFDMIFDDLTINHGYSTCNLGMDASTYKVYDPYWDDCFYKDIKVWNENLIGNFLQMVAENKADNNRN